MAGGRVRVCVCSGTCLAAPGAARCAVWQCVVVRVQRAQEGARGGAQRARVFAHVSSWQRKVVVGEKGGGEGRQVRWWQSGAGGHEKSASAQAERAQADGSGRRRGEGRYRRQCAAAAGAVHLEACYIRVSHVVISREERWRRWR